MKRKVERLIKDIADSKGPTLAEVASQWVESERQLSRIAKAAEQRGMDAVNGLPKKDKTE